jgi:hypothetical protein
MRLTRKKLMDLCNEYLESVEADVRVTELYRTRYTIDQYEGGAAYFNLKIQSGDSPFYCWVHIFYPLKYIEHEINEGSRLIFKPKHNNVYMDGEFDISRY